MDTNNDNQLDLDEFRTGLGMLGMDQDFAHILFASFDTDRSGAINRSEFLAAMAVMLHPSDMEQQISMAFDAYDRNQDGKLDLDEVEHVIGAMFGTMAKMGIRTEGTAEPSAAAAAAELFRHMDADGKGYVKKEDYLRLATTNPEMLKRLGLGGRARGGSRLSESRPASASPGMPVGSRFGVPPPNRPRRRGRGTGTTVVFGHDNWELVVQMMLAIRLSVGRAMKLAREAAKRSSVASIDAPSRASAPAPAGSIGSSGDAAASGVDGDDEHPIDRSMYRDTWSTKIQGSRRGKETSIDFKDYAPLIFRRIRFLFGVSDRDYMLSLGPEQILGELLLGTMGSLAELFSEGKSRSFFYFSNDGKYLIKTIPHRELTSLVELLPKYVRHVEDQPYTLLPRFMGAHRIRMPGGRKVHFVVMTNVFSTPRVIHERFDLKGSTLGRTAGVDNLRVCPDLVRKDLDLPGPFRLRPEAHAQMSAQIASDLQFLREVMTMDYSFLCGVHYPQRENPDDACAGAGGNGNGGGTATGAAGEGDCGIAAVSASGDAGAAVAVAQVELDVGVAEPSLGPLNGHTERQPDSPPPPPRACSSGSSNEAAVEMVQSPHRPPALRSVTTDDVRAVAAATRQAAPGVKSSLKPHPTPRAPRHALYSETASVTTRTRDKRHGQGKARGVVGPWCDFTDGAIIADGGFCSTGEPCIYFIGVIDILTAWTCAKSAENIVKRTMHPSAPNAHSCVPPKRYADRFEAAMLRGWLRGSAS